MPVLSRANFRIIHDKRLPRGRHVGYILKTKGVNNQSEVRFPSLKNAPVYTIKGNKLGNKIGNAPVGKNVYGPISASKPNTEMTRVGGMHGKYKIIVKPSRRASAHIRKIGGK